MKPKNCMNCKHSIQYSYGVFCTWCEPVEIIVVRPKPKPAEGMLEDKESCIGCIFYQYYMCGDDYYSGTMCCNEWYNNSMLPNDNEDHVRPKDCPLRWQYKKPVKQINSSEYDYRDLEDYL